jgi:transcriptional regulator with XRE-family HTH domain
MPLPSEVFRRRLREVRLAKGWTQQQLADALASAGAELTSFAIARLESGKRGVSLDEAVAMAAVLGPSLLHMITPLEHVRVHLAPRLAERAIDVRAWVRGQRPLRQADEQLFYFQAPPSEADWFPFVPGPWRFENRRDFEAARDKWEREILRRGAVPRARDLEDGPDAEDIEVTDDVGRLPQQGSGFPRYGQQRPAPEPPAAGGDSTGISAITDERD